MKVKTKEKVKKIITIKLDNNEVDALSNIILYEYAPNINYSGDTRIILRAGNQKEGEVFKNLIEGIMGEPFWNYCE